MEIESDSNCQNENFGEYINSRPISRSGFSGLTNLMACFLLILTNAIANHTDLRMIVMFSYPEMNLAS